jgi:hypothetical protein
MDSVYPNNSCGSLNVGCVGGSGINYGGGTWISTNYIRNRGETSFVTAEWDMGYPDSLTNNVPATTIYVRCAVSQFDPRKKVLWVNGLERPRIVLTLGKKYQFNVMTCGEPFFFTLDPKGGNGNVDNVSQIQPSDYFKTTITASKNLPKTFYYQTTNVPDMGGTIIIK